MQERKSHSLPLHQTGFEFGLGMDPITLFLALAFADNAFEGDLTLEQVMEMKKAQISTARWFKFKQSKLNGPVFRQCTKNGMTQNGKGMTYDTLLKEYDDLLFRAGFLVQVTLYGLRRNMGNVLDGKVTESERSRVLGHLKASTFARHYASKTPNIDSQSLVLGLEQRKDLTSQFERAGVFRDEDAPKELPDKQLQEIEEDGELSGLRSDRDAKKAELQRDYGSIRKSPILEKSSYARL